MNEVSARTVRIQVKSQQSSLVENKTHIFKKGKKLVMYSPYLSGALRVRVDRLKSERFSSWELKGNRCRELSTQFNAFIQRRVGD